MAISYETLDVEIVDKIGRVHMNRPEKGNSMVAAFWRELPVAVDEMSTSGEVRAMSSPAPVATLLGHGPRRVRRVG